MTQTATGAPPPDFRRVSSVTIGVRREKKNRFPRRSRRPPFAFAAVAEHHAPRNIAHWPVYTGAPIDDRRPLAGAGGRAAAPNPVSSSTLFSGTTTTAQRRNAATPAGPRPPPRGSNSVNRHCVILEICVLPIHIIRTPVPNPFYEILGCNSKDVLRHRGVLLALLPWIVIDTGLRVLNNWPWSPRHRVVCP